MLLFFLSRSLVDICNYLVYNSEVLDGEDYDVGIGGDYDDDIAIVIIILKSFLYRSEFSHKLRNTQRSCDDQRRICKFSHGIK